MTCWKLLGPLIESALAVDNSSMVSATTVVCACCGAHPAVFAIGATPVCETCADEL